MDIIATFVILFITFDTNHMTHDSLVTMIILLFYDNSSYFCI